MAHTPVGHDNFILCELASGCFSSVCKSFSQGSNFLNHRRQILTRRSNKILVGKSCSGEIDVFARSPNKTRAGKLITRLIK